MSERVTIRGWWERYRCGCISAGLPRKRDLLGYCPTHGEDRAELWKGALRKDVASPTYEPETGGGA